MALLMSIAPHALLPRSTACSVQPAQHSLLRTACTALPPMPFLLLGSFLRSTVARILHCESQVRGQSDGSVRVWLYDLGARLPFITTSIVYSSASPLSSHRAVPTLAFPGVGRLPNIGGAGRTLAGHAQLRHDR